MQRSHLVPKYGTRWALMWRNSFLKHTHARIRVRFRCPGTRHKRGHRAPMCTRLCNHCKAHVFFFKNYVWQGGNGVTMYTVTYRVLTVWTRHHFGPVRRQWFLVNVDSPWEMKQNVRISRKRLQLLLDRITLGFSLLIPCKDFKCYGERGGGRGLPISSYGGDWRIFGGLKFSIPGFFWLVFHLRGDFLHFHWWNRRSSRVSRVSLFWGGGVDFCPHSIILSLEIWSKSAKSASTLNQDCE